MSARDSVSGLGERLKATREKSGLSQGQAEERSGVSRVNISRFESEIKVPTIATLYKLAEAYGVNVCELLPGGKLPSSEEKSPMRRGKK
jgi:transcriptional regulator with XRE-family HTH domain